MKLKTFKKLVAGVVATALVGATMVVAPVSAEIHEVPDTYTATLNGQLGEVGFWDADGPSCTVASDGSYSLTYTYSGDTATLTNDNVCVILLMDFNTFTLGDGTSAEGTGIVLTVNSVTLGSTNMNYSGSCVSPAYTRADDGKTLKLNIYNTWNKAQYTQDIIIPTDMTVSSGDTLTVNFTVSGLTDAIARAKEVNSITTVDTANSQVTTDASNTSNTSNSESTSSENGGTTTTTAVSAEGDTTTTTTASGDSSSSSGNSNSSSGNSSSSNSSSSDSSSSDSSSDNSTATESTASDTSDTTNTGLGIVLVVSLAGVMFTKRNHK